MTAANSQLQRRAITKDDGEPDYRQLWQDEATKRMLAEKDLAGKRLQIANLRNELDQVRENEPRIQDARKVFNYWVARINPRAKVFGPERKKKTLARLAEFTIEDLNHAIDGAYLRPWVKNGVVYDDLATILKSEKSVAHFIQVADLELRPRDQRVCEHPAVRYLERLGCGPGEFDAIFDVWRYTCPRCLSIAADRGLGMLLRRTQGRWACRNLTISCSGEVVYCGVCGATDAGLIAGLCWLVNVNPTRGILNDNCNIVGSRSGDGRAEGGQPDAVTGCAGAA